MREKKKIIHLEFRSYVSMNNLFGRPASRPVIKKVTPVQTVEPTADEKQDMIKLLARRYRATI